MRFNEFTQPPQQPSQPKMPEYDFEAELDLSDIVKGLLWGSTSKWDYSNSIVGVVSGVEYHDTKRGPDTLAVVDVYEVWAPIGVDDEGEGGDWVDIKGELDSETIDSLEEQAVEHEQWKNRNTFSHARYITRSDFEN
jgi:hypothetical protein